MRWVIIYALFISSFLLILPAETVAQITEDDPEITVRGDVSSVFYQNIANNRDTQFEVTLDLESRSGNNNYIETEDGDGFVITFPENFVVPSSIDAVDIEIDDDPSAGVAVNGQEITVLSPKTYNGGKADIHILSSAGIINPIDDGWYTIEVTVDVENTGNADIVAGEFDVDIQDVPSMITSPSVIPSPSVANVRARYEINFELGGGGRMPSGETITLEFDEATTVTSSNDMGGVTINGTSVTASADGQSTVVVTTPQTYDSGQQLTIEFSRASGLENPPVEGEYVLEAYTSIEETPVESSPILISDPENLSFSSIFLSENTANAQSGYNIEFITGSNSDLFTESDEQADLINFEFPENTNLPASISSSRVVISTEDGFVNEARDVDVDQQSRTVELAVPFDIPGGSEVAVQFDEIASIQNPSQAKNPDPEVDNYSLQAYTTTAQGDTVDSKTPSNPYSLATPSTQISTVEVNLNGEFNPGATTTYTVTFDSGDFGRLEENFNTISLRFPSGTELPDPGQLTARIEGVTVNEVTEIEENREIKLGVPSGVSLPNNSSVSVEVDNVQNPEAEDSYSLLAQTSAEPHFVQSSKYQIGDADLEIQFAGPVVNSGDNQVSENISVNDVGTPYFIDINGAHFWEGTSGTFFIRFPQGTVLPGSSEITPGNIDFEGGNQTDLVSVNVRDDRTLEFSFSTNNQPPEVEEIFIPDDVAITLPTIPREDYHLQVWASNSVNRLPGDVYELDSRNEQVAGVSMTASPAVQNFEDPEYTVQFTTGNNGRLRGGTTQGSNVISVQLPEVFDASDGSNFPDDIPASEVTVNGNSVSNVGVDAQNQIIEIDVPAGLVIANNVNVKIKIGSGAGLQNPDAGTYQVGVQTDVEEGGFTPGDVVIEESSELSFTGLNISENEINAAASYLINFRTGTLDTLGQGDQIELDFDEKVGLPEDIGSSRITVDGTNPGNVSVNGTKVVITLDKGQDLVGDESYSINISSLAGILHPYDPGEYTFDLILPESVVISDTYTVIDAQSTISQPDVSVTNTSAGAITDYTISFSTGSNGRLPEGDGTITMEFPIEVDITGYGTITLNEEPLTQQHIDDTDAANGVLVLTVPEGMSIRNNSSVEVALDNIVNPDEGTYRITAYTSVEDDPMESSRFFIGDSDIIVSENTEDFEIRNQDGNPIDLEQEGPIVNTHPAFTVTFDHENAINQLIVRFPTDTQFSSAENIDSSIEIRNELGNLVSTAGAENVSTSDRTVTYGPFDVPGTEEQRDLILNTNEGITFSREPEDNVRFEITSDQTPERFSNTLEFDIIPSPEEVSTVSNLSVRRSTDDPGVDVEWEWEFTTGEYGALKPGEGSVYFKFAGEVDLPESIATDFVRFIEDNERFNPNETEVDQETNIVTLRVPSEITIESNALVIIKIDGDAGIQLQDEESGETQSRALAQSEDYSILQEEEDDDTYEASTSAEPTSTETQDTEELPVELAEVKISSNTGSGGSTLIWKTETERENEGFDIERRFGDDEQWQHVAFVEGTGTTTEMQEYKFTDHDLSKAGTYNYRIVQKDYDGTSQIYGPFEFTFAGPDDYELSQNYPNPFNPVTTIPFEVPEATEVTMEVFNVIGKRVKTLVDQHKDPGIYTVEFDGSRLASGTYIVRFQAGGVMETMQITLVK